MRRFAALALCCTALVLTTASAQVAEGKKKFRVAVPYDGPELFARLLDHAGLAPIGSREQLEESAADQTIIIVFGDPKPLIALDRGGFRPKWNDGLGGFVERGGALFIATDRLFSFDEIPSLGWKNVITANADLVNDVQNFENQPECPTLLRKQFRQPEHPLFAGITQPIATNCPGYVSTTDNTIQTLAVLPFGTMPGMRRDDLEPIVPIASLPPRYIVAGPEAGGRVLLIAGHGLFTNCLTIRDDIDNRRLALNAIQWLKDDKRTRVLLINEGQFVANFKMPLSGPPKMPPPTIDLVNRIIDALQKTDIVQRIFDRILGPENFLRGMLLLGTFGLLLYGFKKYFQSR